VNLSANLASMSVDALWEIHEEISKLLKVKMLAETKTLESRLIILRPAEVDRRSIRARCELQNDRRIGQAQLQGCDAMKAGDRVKLTDAAASRLMNAYHRRGVLDWRKRRGTLHHVKLTRSRPWCSGTVAHQWR
jgi:hypothetical protein